MSACRNVSFWTESGHRRFMISADSFCRILIKIRPTSELLRHRQRLTFCQFRCPPVVHLSLQSSDLDHGTVVPRPVRAVAGGYTDINPIASLTRQRQTSCGTSRHPSPAGPRRIRGKEKENWNSFYPQVARRPKYRIGSSFKLKKCLKVRQKLGTRENFKI